MSILNSTAPRGLMGIQELQEPELNGLLDRARQHKQDERERNARDTIATILSEEKRSSFGTFQQAITDRGYHHIDFKLERSSISKGESIVNSFITLRQIGVSGVLLGSDCEQFTQDSQRIATKVGIQVVLVGGASHAGVKNSMALLDKKLHSRKARATKFKRSKGKSIATLFRENSTRTLLSFQVAIKRLGYRHEDLLSSPYKLSKRSSSDKLAAVVIRSSKGSHAKLIAKIVGIPLINAGTGVDEHPTQALTDLLTMNEQFGNVKGIKVAIIGDVKHSRVARSFIAGLSMLGADMRAFAPPPMRPAMKMDWRDSIEDAIADAQVAFVLRPQFERHQGSKITPQEYAERFMFRPKHLDTIRRNDGFVMHAGPVNEDVDIAAEVLPDACSLIEEQVRNSVFARMAALEYALEVAGR